MAGPTFRLKTLNFLIFYATISSYNLILYEVLQPSALHLSLLKPYFAFQIASPLATLLTFSTHLLLSLQHGNTTNYYSPSTITSRPCSCAYRKLLWTPDAWPTLAPSRRPFSKSSIPHSDNFFKPTVFNPQLSTATTGESFVYTWDNTTALSDEYRISYSSTHHPTMPYPCAWFFSTPPSQSLTPAYSVGLSAT